MVFYVHACVCAVILALWAYNFSDEPYRHPFVSDKEFKKISIGKAPKVAKYNPPYKQIFKTPVIWGIYAATGANFLFSQFAVIYSPMYFVYVSGLKLSYASMVCAIPLIFQFIFKCLAGTLSDRIHFISDLWKIRIFNTIAFWGSGILLIICTFIPDGNDVLTMVFVIAAVSFLGFNAGGFTKCTVIVAKQFSPTVMAVTQVIMCLALFGGSFLVPGLTPDGTKEQYNTVFLVYASCLIICNVIFCILAKGEAAEWTKPVIEEKKTFKSNVILTPGSLGSSSNYKVFQEHNLGNISITVSEYSEKVEDSQLPKESNL